MVFCRRCGLPRSDGPLGFVDKHIDREQKPASAISVTLGLELMHSHSANDAEDAHGPSGYKLAQAC